MSVNVDDQLSGVINHFIPKKLAVKFNPPVIALEYYHPKMYCNYLLQINLEDVIKSQNNEPNEISNWIFHNYCDVFSLKLISQKQVVKLIQKILKNKQKTNSETKIRNLKLQLFEPDVSRKEDEKVFYKSTQNFFSEGNEKINSIDDNELKEENKKEKKSESIHNNKINQYLSKDKLEEKIKNNNVSKNLMLGKVDFDENYYSNDLSIESLHSY